jgi:hypothetical protein
MPRVDMTSVRQVVGLPRSGAKRKRPSMLSDYLTRIGSAPSR